MPARDDNHSSDWADTPGPVQDGACFIGDASEDPWTGLKSNTSPELSWCNHCCIPFWSSLSSVGEGLNKLTSADVVLVDVMGRLVSKDLDDLWPMGPIDTCRIALLGVVANTAGRLRCLAE
jgi:hypothetical protein